MARPAGGAGPGEGHHKLIMPEGSKINGIHIPEGFGFDAPKEVEQNKLDVIHPLVNKHTKKKLDSIVDTKGHDFSVDSSDDVICQEQTTNTTDQSQMKGEPVLDKWKTRRVECPKCKKLILKAHLKRHIKANHKYKRTFSCNLYGCGRGFVSKKKLEHHVMYYHEENIPVPEDKICPYCEADLKSVVDYKYHVQRDHNHHCEQCRLRFAVKHKLEEHVLTAHQQDIRVDKTCGQCGAVQRGLTDYYRHIGKEHCWECEVPGCLLRFAQKQKLEEHALTAHRLDIKVDKTCQLCQQEIRSLSDFRTHILRDHRFTCPFPGCALRFACKPKLEEHTVACHETNIKVDRTCPHCQNTIRGLTDYFRHVEKDHRFPCSLCQLRFACRQKYEEHMLAVHEEDAKAERTCPLCQTALKSLAEYRRHAALEHRFQCPACCLRFACKARLAAHCLAGHGRDLAGCAPTLAASGRSFTGNFGSRSFSCELCCATLPAGPAWEAHCRLAHPFPCTLCPCRFAATTALESHRRARHPPEEPAAHTNHCPLCGQGFTRTENLKKHLIRPHTFPCHLCARTFPAPDRLERHRRSEHRPAAGPRAVYCQLCGKNFKQLHILRKHRGIAHKHPCPVCEKRFTKRPYLREHLGTAHTGRPGGGRELPGLLRIHRPGGEVPCPWPAEGEEGEEVSCPWPGEEGMEEVDGFSDSSSSFSLPSQEVLEPQVTIEELAS